MGQVITTQDMAIITKGFLKTFLPSTAVSVAELEACLDVGTPTFAQLEQWAAGPTPLTNFPYLN